MGRGGKNQNLKDMSAANLRPSSGADFVVGEEGISFKSKKSANLQDIEINGEKYTLKSEPKTKITPVPGPWIQKWYGKDIDDLESVIESSFQENENGQKAVAHITPDSMGPSIVTEVAYSKSKNKNGKHLVAIKTTQMSEPTQDDTGGLMVMRFSRKPLDTKEEVIEVDPNEIVDIEKMAREKTKDYVEEKEAEHLAKTKEKAADLAKKLQEELEKDPAEREIEALLGNSKKSKSPQPRNII